MCRPSWGRKGRRYWESGGHILLPGVLAIERSSTDQFFRGGRLLWDTYSAVMAESEGGIKRRCSGRLKAKIGNAAGKKGGRLSSNNLQIKKEWGHNPKE